MKKLVLFLSLFLGVSQAVAVPNIHINLASSNLGSSYTAVFPQLTLTGLVGKSHFGIVNTASGAVCCNTVTASPINPPSAADGGERCFPANSQAFLDFTQISANVYCRSLSGTLSTGTLDVWTW
jgi:hypothetical protein